MRKYEKHQSINCHSKRGMKLSATFTIDEFVQIVDGRSMEINSQTFDLAPPHVKQSMKFHNIFLQI